MTKAPTLSICVPSRNRQETFRQTILDLIGNPRTDVEFVFADNSDDPAIMNTFIAGITDPRIRYLPALPETLAMQDNWERCMETVTGDWVVFIGDDDYVDPDVLDVIAEILKRRPETEAIAWNRPSFKWPSFRPFAGNLSFSLRNEAHLADRTSLIRCMFRWEGATAVPSVPFTIYHGAVSRAMMETIKGTYGGRYFEHPTVDFDCGFKLMCAAKHFVMVNRPLSILGATEKSNSAVVGRFARALESYETFLREKGSRFESGEAMENFPFKASLGIAASVMSAQHWFKTKYNVHIDGWEENFVQALARDCSRAIDKSEFDMHVELCQRALARFAGGKFTAAFKPRFTGGHAGMFTGVMGSNLYINEAIGGCQTPAELYGILQSLLEPLSALKYNLDRQGLVQAA